ncbi:MAG: M23 family metallopeptidase [Fibrobacteraceae bacterium]|mgnify:CR=1 FL=1|nr:M23 family metallopeptidase [Fibrobacteraceae bacterium]
MSKKYYTIQIIPENSQKTKQFRISTKWFFLGKIASCLFIIFLVVFIIHIGKINTSLIRFEKMKVTNAQLVKKQANYEELFSRLDSLWVLEHKIQNIFETYLENDSNKINTIIDRNRFAHTPSEKINVDFEGVHGWQSAEEKARLEHTPDIIPTIGIISKKFSRENEHLGTDIAASMGNPVFATASGVVESAANDKELGNTIIIDHKNGYKTSYSHLKELKTKKGRNVKKGDVIGTVGSTGKSSSGPHLHYTIMKLDYYQNPETFFNY